MLLGLAAGLTLPIAGIAAPAPAACTIGHYRLVSLPLRPVAINDAGQVAGTTSSHRAAVWTRDVGLKELPLPPGFTQADAVSINNHGDIVEIAHDPTFSTSQAFLYSNAALAPLSGDKARPFQIGESNRIAGEALLPGKQRTEPVLWQNGSLRPLGACCGGSAKSVNERGEAIGDAYDEQGRYYAFLWTEAAGLQRIGPPNRFSSAVALNNLGHVVIESFPGILFYDAGSLISVRLAPKFPSHPRAINDCDVMVGAYGPFADAYRAFAWEKSGGFFDLNSRIAPGVGWKLESATGINNRGEIVGKGDPPGAEDTGFLLIPE